MRLFVLSYPFLSSGLLFMSYLFFSPFACFSYDIFPPFAGISSHLSFPISLSSFASPVVCVFIFVSLAPHRSTDGAGEHHLPGMAQVGCSPAGRGLRAQMRTGVGGRERRKKRRRMAKGRRMVKGEKGERKVGDGEGEGEGDGRGRRG